MASPDGAEPIPLYELAPGMRVEILPGQSVPGQSVPVAATLDSDAAEFSLESINGEADPHTFFRGRPVPAGAIHLGSAP